MANLASKKSNYLSILVDYAAKASSLARDIQELNNYFIDNGFATAGANAIVDADCVGENAHLTAALVNAAMTAIVNVNLTPAQRTTMRQVTKDTIPPRS